MALDFSPTPVPTTLGALWEAFKRLAYSLSRDQKRLVHRGYALSTGSNLVPHGQAPDVPKAVSTGLVGQSASTAVLTVGTIGPTHVTIYATAGCTADIEVTL